MNIISEMLSYSFLVRALIAGAIVSLCAAILGVSLVLRRFSMIGDGLSHVGFGALAVGSALGFAPLYVAVPVVVLAAFLLLRVRSTYASGDSAIALISAVSFAVGMIAMSLKTGSTAGVSSYMFGSILAVSPSDMRLCIILGVFVLILFTLFYKKLFAVTFDEDFARACGVGASFQNTLTAVLTAVTIVLGMRLMGALLISSLVIFPGLSAMRVQRSFGAVVVTGAILSLICFFAGMVFSYALSIPAGATIVAVNAVCYGVCFTIGKLKKG